MNKHQENVQIQSQQSIIDNNTMWLENEKNEYFEVKSHRAQFNDA